MDEYTREYIAEIRRDIIVAVNEKDFAKYMQYAQELVIATAQTEEEAQQEVGIFLMAIERTFREFKGAN
jgi:hypothetical protein